MAPPIFCAPPPESSLGRPFCSMAGKIPSWPVSCLPLPRREAGSCWSTSSNQSRPVLPRRPRPFDEILQVIGHRHAVAFAAHLYFPGDIRRQVLRPVLERVEGENADRIFELSGQQIGNDRFEIAPFDLALDAPGRAGILDDDKNSLVSAIRYAWRCEAGHGDSPPSGFAGSTDDAGLPFLRGGTNFRMSCW